MDISQSQKATGKKKMNTYFKSEKKKKKKQHSNTTTLAFIFPSLNAFGKT